MPLLSIILDISNSHVLDFDKPLFSVFFFPFYRAVHLRAPPLGLSYHRIVTDQLTAPLVVDGPEAPELLGSTLRGRDPPRATDRLVLPPTGGAPWKGCLPQHCQGTLLRHGRTVCIYGTRCRIVDRGTGAVLTSVLAPCVNGHFAENVGGTIFLF